MSVFALPIRAVELRHRSVLLECAATRLRLSDAAAHVQRFGSQQMANNKADLNQQIRQKNS